MKKRRLTDRILGILLAFVLAGAMLPLGAFGTHSAVDASPQTTYIPNDHPATREAANPEGPADDAREATQDSNESLVSAPPSVRGAAEGIGGLPVLAIDFEDFSLGNIDNQHGWLSPQGDNTIVNTEAHSGTQSLESSGPSGFTAWIPFQPIESGTVSFWFYPNFGTLNNAADYSLLIGMDLAVSLRIDGWSPGSISLKTYDGQDFQVLFDSVSLDNWHKVEIVIDSLAFKYKVRFDGGAWTAEYDWLSTADSFVSSFMITGSVNPETPIYTDDIYVTNAMEK